MLLQFNGKLNETFITAAFYISSWGLFLVSEFHLLIKLKGRHVVVWHSLSFSLQKKQSYASHYTAIKTLLIFWFDSLNKDYFGFFSFRRLRQRRFKSDQAVVAKTKTGIFLHHKVVAMLEQMLIQSPITQINIIAKNCFFVRKPLDFMETTLKLKEKKYSHKILKNHAVTI